MLNLADEIKKSISLKEVLENHNIKFNDKGFACCPFHNEKTPSFSIYKVNKYHCFGCGKSGDVITFIMEYYNIPFKEAIKKLDDDYRLGLIKRKSEISPAERRKRHLELEAKKEAAEKQRKKEEYSRYAYLRLCDFRRWLASLEQSEMTKQDSEMTKQDIEYMDRLLDKYLDHTKLIEFDVEARIRALYFKYKIRGIGAKK